MTRAFNDLDDVVVGMQEEASYVRLAIVHYGLSEQISQVFVR